MFGFDEPKARALVSYLLENDISVYRNLIPEINSLNSEAFMNLFEGTPFKEDNNDNEGYNYDIKRKKDFKCLIDKFSNFHFILEEWYKDKKYYEYLKPIWKKYITIQNLIDLGVEKVLLSFDIDYSNWPKDIKESFSDAINGSQTMKNIRNLKEIVQKKFPEFNSLIEELVAFQSEIKNIREMKPCEKSADSIIELVCGENISIFASGFSGFSTFSASKGTQDINFEQLKTVENLIADKTNGPWWEARLLARELKKDIKSKKGRSIQNAITKEPLTYLKDFENKLQDIKIKCNNGNFDMLNFSAKAKVFLNNKYVLLFNQVLTFLNLGWTLYEFYQTYKGLKEVEAHDTKLKEIKKKVDDNIKKIQDLPKDDNECIKLIKEVLEIIRAEQKNLIKLIEGIKQSIKNQESQQKKAGIRIGVSGVMTIFSIAAAVITKNPGYIFSSVTNGASTAINGANLGLSIKIANDLQNILEKANSLSKTIEEEIKKLISELEMRQKKYQ